MAQEVFCMLMCICAFARADGIYLGPVADTRISWDNVVLVTMCFSGIIDLIPIEFTEFTVTS